MIKEFSNNGRTFLAVEVPEGAIFWDEDWSGPPVQYDPDARELRLYAELPDGCGYPEKLTALPEGKWKLIGRFNDISEEQAEQMVDQEIIGIHAEDGSFTGVPDGYINYTSNIPFSFDEATGSLKSRLTDYGLNPDNTVLLQKIDE